VLGHQSGQALAGDGLLEHHARVPLPGEADDVTHGGPERTGARVAPDEGQRPVVPRQRDHRAREVMDALAALEAAGVEQAQRPPSAKPASAPGEPVAPRNG